MSARRKLRDHPFRRPVAQPLAPHRPQQYRNHHGILLVDCPTIRCASSTVSAAQRVESAKQKCPHLTLKCGSPSVQSFAGQPILGSLIAKCGLSSATRYSVFFVATSSSLPRLCRLASSAALLCRSLSRRLGLRLRHHLRVRLRRPLSSLLPFTEDFFAATFFAAGFAAPLVFAAAAFFAAFATGAFFPAAFFTTTGLAGTFAATFAATGLPAAAFAGAACFTGTAAFAAAPAFGSTAFASAAFPFSARGFAATAAGNPSPA